METEKRQQTRFLIKNTLKGLVWLGLVILAYIAFEEIVIARNPELWFERFYSKPWIIYLGYFISEFFFGLLPPELFLMWAAHKGGLGFYLLNLSLFAIVSYAMGYANFLIGQFLANRNFFKTFSGRYMKKTLPLLKKYGPFLIIIAALTPVPWSASSLLVGSAGYLSKKYLLFGLTRIARFAVYGFFVLQAAKI